MRFPTGKYYNKNHFIYVFFSLKKLFSNLWLGFINTVCQICRAGKPPVGLHLDVLKGEKLIQKLMIDDKKCYLFGRNSQMNDFCIDHASCSRVHSAFVYHKHLNRAFLVDLGSSEYRK